MKKNGMIKKCLKRGLMGMGILVTGLAVYQNPAQARVIYGEVVGVKDDGSSFSFKRPNPSNPSVTAQFDIAVLPNTKFGRILSLKELAAGDKVVVDAEKNRDSGIWQASFVRILDAKIY